MGLIGGMARTAVVAGTTTAVSNRVSRRQTNRWAEKDQQPRTTRNPSTRNRDTRNPDAQPQYAQPQYTRNRNTRRRLLPHRPLPRRPRQTSRRSCNSSHS